MKNYRWNKMLPCYDKIEETIFGFEPRFIDPNNYPTVGEHVLAIVRGKPVILMMEHENGDWESGTKGFDYWTNPHNDGDFIEHHEVEMWKYLYLSQDALNAIKEYENYNTLNRIRYQTGNIDSVLVSAAEQLHICICDNKELIKKLPDITYDNEECIIFEWIDFNGILDCTVFIMIYDTGWILNVSYHDYTYENDGKTEEYNNLISGTHDFMRMFGEKPNNILESSDARVWAKEFMRIFGSRKDEIDLALMESWFANAIETGRSVDK